MAADVVAATAQRGEGTSVKLTMLTAEPDPTSVLPALALLPHKVRAQQRPGWPRCTTPA